MLPLLAAPHIPKTLLILCQHIADAGGKAWLVGGCVRDFQLGIKAKDWDIEVYQLEPEKLWQCLEALGNIVHVGKQFGVCKLWLNGFEIDVALPRTEKKSSMGHRGFEVTPNPWIKPQQASLRRDFSINAMMFDPLEHQLLDFHGGAHDLKHKTLRHLSPAFAEDPLRPLRAMQFAARFKLILHPKTAKICQSLLAEAETLPPSRVWQEWLKWAEADHPSYGLKALADSTWLTCYPELQALIACPKQGAYWHPEGDVWVHTCLVVDAAAKLKTKRNFNSQQQIQLIFAALCHDLGKPATTLTNEQGKTCAPQHAVAGTAPSSSFLRRIAAPKALQQTLLPLVQEHISHLRVKPSKRAVFHLAHRLQPASIELWEALTEAYASARSPAASPSRPALAWVEQAQKLHVQQQQAPAMITGKTLINNGIKPSPLFKTLLHQAYQAQLDGSFNDRASAELWLAKHSSTATKL